MRLETEADKKAEAEAETETETEEEAQAGKKAAGRERLLAVAWEEQKGLTYSC